MDVLISKKKEDEGQTPATKVSIVEQFKSKIADLQQLNEVTNRHMYSVLSQISRTQVITDDDSTNHMELRRLTEENAHLKNASMMTHELAEDKQSLMTELSTLQQTNKALRQEFDNLIVHHQQEIQNVQIAQVNSEGALSQRLQEMSKKLGKETTENVEDIRETLDKVQAELTEGQSTISEHETTIAELEDLLSKILATPTSVTETGNDIDDGLGAKYLTNISELELLVEEALFSAQPSQTRVSELEEALPLPQSAENRVSELERALTFVKSADESVADYPTKSSEYEKKLFAKEVEVKDLKSKMKKLQDELQNRVEIADELKQKNNELREKNWKVVDDLAKAKQINAKNAKRIDIAVKKGLKKLFPDLKLPKVDNDIDRLFTEFASIVKDSVKDADSLHKQVEVLSNELQSEKQTKESLVSKLEDLEKFEFADSAVSLEDKLKFAEQKILELEAQK